MLKFRTMVDGASRRGGLLTAAGDPRVTRAGRLLRSTKLDELPQLLNVLRGDMSLVGPRPEVAPYVTLFVRDYRTILTVRPGMTDLASLKYCNEEALLARVERPDVHYLSVILPDKINLAKQYVARRSMRLDLELILLTIGRVLRRHAAPVSGLPA
jgi:lipopolysaccharide/colanic/teichoic acid biosynthesis glycosyltransferase